MRISNITMSIIHTKSKLKHQRQNAGQQIWHFTLTTDILPLGEKI